jgi:hypothetical protein
MSGDGGSWGMANDRGGKSGDDLTGSLVSWKGGGGGEHGDNQTGQGAEIGDGGRRGGGRVVVTWERTQEGNGRMIMRESTKIQCMLVNAGQRSSIVM